MSNSTTSCGRAISTTVARGVAASEGDALAYGLVCVARGIKSGDALTYIGRREHMILRDLHDELLVQKRESMVYVCVGAG